MTRAIVPIKHIEKLTPDTLRFVTEKPPGFSFRPGQATEIAIHLDGQTCDKQPFSITSIPADDYLEFIIKVYPEHDGTTDKMQSLKPGDELILDGVFGTIAYRGEGVFIAGGSGVTPFLSILRDLQKDHRVANNRLIFANKTHKDIILKEELDNMLGDGITHVLSSEKVEGLAHGRINDGFLKAHVNGSKKYYYLCGPPAMMETVQNGLRRLGVEEAQFIKESW